jgi:hypothetical protein
MKFKRSKLKKAMIDETLIKILIAVTVLVVIAIALSIFRIKGISAIDYAKNLLRFR